jgi:hypothetical protein
MTGFEDCDIRPATHKEMQSDAASLVSYLHGTLSERRADSRVGSFQARGEAVSGHSLQDGTYI